MSDLKEKIADGKCVSDRGVDHCQICVDTCEASRMKFAIKELKQSICIHEFNDDSKRCIHCDILPNGE